MTGALKELGYNIIGVDKAPERLKEVIEILNIRVFKCDIETESILLDESSVDGVIFNEVFEHLRINLIFTMKEVHRVLKPNGILMLSTPNLRSVRGIVNFLFKNNSYSLSNSIYDEYEKLNKLGHMGHLREYTPKDVSDFLFKIGFKPEKIIYRGTYGQKYYRILIKLFPSLRPYFSLILRK